MTTATDNFLSPYRSDGKLYGFVCIVTGATHPIGRAIVTELAAHGAACVYACSSSPREDFNSLEAEVNKESPNTKVIGYPFHLANEEDTLMLIDDVLNSWGRLDIFVTSSSLLGPSSITDTTPSDLLKLFEANALMPFLALKYAPAAMAKTSPKGTYPNAQPKDRAYGSIIVVSSVASTLGSCWGPAFTMSSHAALGLVKSGVAALKGTGVRINCVSAGQIDVGVHFQDEHSKETNELERAGVPNEVARAVGFLASGFSSYVTGTNLVVDGGSSVSNPQVVPVA
ncbi:hypothetical protein CLAFUW4_00212 [Fulvia fulva]|uniref:Peroxisomal trans-2-enoyl-CoA reductase n=1 Tax=Passalora fulva TaxID=5499 RepID=A0A9Q8L7W7_PASFU|nr:uncharacterized protein CLAFUR5_00212 [Fulvia fulva]KAK4636150.1 hypothetical protein CLAFUR4_00212 [Fulvia fulva]KAK4638165.1 hypothetical protein CLAFUR0_00213 [Fulvia fulva]UJO11813.1 hypothetical protein CLAFUR5_00212 [Fulvia fulva]WPV09528.1 hypothetical protein CLAFUW4_00212 [Fulvia fulva]WPV24426.1 hypothetical protein CLAFUW7_00215 [Fulvia fulva]